MGVSAVVASAVIGAISVGVSVENARQARHDAGSERNRQTAIMKKNEKELKDRTANEDALATAKMKRSQQQNIAYGAANTKNNTLKSTALGVSPTAGSGGTKTLLGT
jgi:hypothetical protein